MVLSKNKTKILILTHYAFRAEEGEDTDQRILRYLKDKVKKLVLITHPFPEFGYRYSYLTIYENGKKVRQIKIYVFKGPSLLQYLYHTILIYYFLLKVGFAFDLCIAMENLSFISVFPLRFINLFKRLVYYSFDFVPRRFQNPILNWIYYFIYKFACKYSDTNWVMAKAQIEGNKLLGLNRFNSAPFSLVPIGYETKNINVLSADKVAFYNLVYAGGLRESYGPQLAIKAMPLLIKKFPKIRLTLIGVGKYENQLKKLINDLKINKYVDFRGFIPSFKELTDTISQKSIGLAPYAPIPGSNSFYSDPSKIKLYICCGLPVITTKVTTIGSLLEKTNSGMVIDFSEQALCDAITQLLGSKNKYKSYKDAAIKLSKRFDINHIMNIAIKKIP